MDVLADLSALEELIVEVAKWKFREEYKGRKRVPRRFADGVALVLTGVGEGSAKPVIQLMLAANTLLPPAAVPYFHEARAAITEAVAAADRSQQVTVTLPSEYLGYFNRIGRRLKPGEAIEFPTGDAAAPARLTPESRRRLVLASSKESEVTEAVALPGSVTELDLTLSTFHFQLLDGSRVKGPAESVHLDALMDALEASRKNLKVLIVGSGRVNRSNKLQRIESVEHVIPLDPLDLSVRFHEFGQLRPGWLNGKGIPPAPAALDRLAAEFDSLFPADLPLPFAYPTAEGGVRFEWAVGRHDLSLDIDLDTRRGRWHDLRLDTDAEVEQLLSLDLPADWKWMGEQIRRLTEGEG